MKRRAGVFATAAAVVSGCGGDGGDTGTVESDIAEYASVGELAAAANAAVAEQRTATFELDDHSGEDSVGSGQLRFDDDGLAVSMTTVQDGQDVEFRVVGDVFYMKADGELAAASGGKTWIKFEKNGQDPISRMLGGLFSGIVKEMDPARTFELSEAAGSIASSERTTIDGDAVMRYGIDLDVAKMADYAAREAGEQSLQVRAIRKAAGLGITSVHTEVWLDGDDLPRRFVIPDSTALAESDGSPGDVGGDEVPTMTLDYTGWGADVDVAAPPESEVGTVQMPG